MSALASRRAGDRGAALILVVWIFMVLGVLALDFGRYMRDDARAAINFQEETEAYYVALAGMNHALFEVQEGYEEGEEFDGGLGKDEGEEEEEDEDEEDEEDTGAPRTIADGEWHRGVFGESQYEVRMTDEGGKIALNWADEVLLGHVLTTLIRGGNATESLSSDETDEIASLVDAILDWRDPDDLERLHGAESEYYLGLETPYEAKNAWFDAPEELLLVRGVTPELFYGSEGSFGLRDVFSVYSRSETVNVRTAPAPVLQALLGIDAAEAEELVARREEEPETVLEEVQTALVALDARLEEKITSEAANIVVIEARGDLARERNQAQVAAVVDLNSDLIGGPRIIRWLDRAPWTGPLPTAVPDEEPLA